MVLDAARVRVVTLGSDEFLELEAARRGKKRLFYQCKGGVHAGPGWGGVRPEPGDLARINRFSYNTSCRRAAHRRLFAVGEPPREVSMGMPAVKRAKPGAVHRQGASPAPTSGGTPRPAVATAVHPAVAVTTPSKGGQGAFHQAGADRQAGADGKAGPAVPKAGGAAPGPAPKKSRFSTFAVDASSAGLRLDQFLARALGGRQRPRRAPPDRRWPRPRR